jgi:hypothetical protein
VNAVPYVTRTGAKQFRPKATEAEVMEGTTGFCLACGHQADGVEPDARKYTCEACQAPKVYGLEELTAMGLLILRTRRGRD